MAGYPRVLSHIVGLFPTKLCIKSKPDFHQKKVFIGTKYDAF